MLRLLLCIALVLPAGQAFALHHPANREQWQPQTESDQRLQKAVEIDIIGRAVTPALVILSEATGVSLSVAPENLETLGERKLTIIPRGCTLKTIMAQIPAALRECHWDVGTAGEVPVYLLHRNAGARATILKLRRSDRLRPDEERRALRSSRVEAARRALAMSPAQLARLEQTDILLARTVRDSIGRPAVEAMFSLPEDKMDLLLSVGEAEIAFEEAPEWLQGIARQDLRWNWTEDLPWEKGVEPSASLVEEAVSAVRFVWRCFYAGVTVGMKRGGRESIAAFAVPPVCPHRGTEQPFERLLMRTGSPREEAREILRRLTERWPNGLFTHPQPEPAAQPDPHLSDVVRADCAEPLDFAEVLQIIAQATDRPVISDYFTMGPLEVAEQVRREIPLWELLAKLSDSADYEWRRTGRCLVFNHSRWYEMVRDEVPESLLAPYRAKLEAGEQLSPRELVLIAKSVHGRPYRERDADPPEERYFYDLMDSFGRWALGFCDTISEEQAPSLFSPKGLGFGEMREDQQAELLAQIRSWAVAREAAQSPDPLALHIRALTYDREGTLWGSVRIHVSFEKDAGGGTSMRFRLPYPPARCAGRVGLPGSRHINRVKSVKPAPMIW